jgi:hypothetical protein
MSGLRTAKVVTHILTKDPAASQDFYVTKLGLAIASSDEFGVALEVAHAVLRITEIPNHVAGEHPVMGWEVPDIKKAALALLEVGIKLTIYEGYGQDDLGIWSSPDGATKVAWFNDPDGNVLSLSQA